MKISSAFPSDYLKAADLNGKGVRVTIAGVTMEKLGEETKPLLHFIGKERGLILNKTNSNRLVEATGSDETDDWMGWSVVLYPAKVDYQGKRVDAIRIDDRPGATKPPAKKAPVLDADDDIDIPAIDDEPIPF